MKKNTYFCMEKKNKIKKAQSLPLNTIVIALLVIVVLLVIIVFFTTSVGKSGKALNKNSATSCSLSNAAIKTLGYTDVKLVEGTKCTDGYSEISFVGTVNDSGTMKICCGKK